MAPADVFPTLHCCTRLLHIASHDCLYDAKFYPYPTEDDDQIFAVAGMRDVLVCRPILQGERPFELLRWFKDEDPETSFNSIVWTKNPTTRRPQLCVAGAKPKQIKILDVDTGEPVRTLPGHGKGINDLAISPISTNLLASASDDYTIRLWNLDPEYEDQPCVAIFSGEGHRQPIQAAQFHPNGRWIISGGLDTAVCLWAVPDPSELASRHHHQQQQQEGPSSSSSSTTTRNADDVKFIHYPLFYSTEVHHNYVDSVAFYGDLILSRAAKDPVEKSNEILLWKIEGFDAEAPAPLENPPVPQPGVHTRSAFPHDEAAPFQRLLTFSMPWTGRFYHRFGLLHKPDMHPVLVMGNQQSRFSFWDLQRLEEGWEAGADEGGGGGGGGAGGTGTGFKPKPGRGGARKRGKIVGGSNLDLLRNLAGSSRNAEETPSVFSDSTGVDGRRGSTPLQSATSVSAPSERRYAIGDPFYPLAPHFTTSPNTSLSLKKHFATSQLAWSPDGTWLVSVGDSGVMCLFHRDRSVVNGVPKAAASN